MSDVSDIQGEIAPAAAAPGTDGSARETTGASIARGGLWEVAGKALPQVYVFVISAVVARFLGPDIFGRVVLISGVQNAVSTIALWGVPYSLIRYVGEVRGAGRSTELRSLLAWSYVVMIPAALVGFGFMAGAALLGAKPAVVWLIAATTSAVATIQAVPSAFLTGAQKWGQARIMGIASGAFSMLAKVVALALGGGIVILFSIDLVVVVANLVGTAVLASRHHRPLGNRPASAQLKRAILRFASVAGITVAANLVLYQRTEVFVLAHYRNDADIARYSVPYALVTALLLVPTAAASVLTPAVATLWGAGELDRIRSGVGRALRIMMLLTLTLAGAAAATGPVFIRVIYGSAFGHAQLVVLLLVLGVPIVPLGTLSVSVLTGVGHLRWLTILGVLGALLNVALSFLLIPWSGSSGAAAANTLAQVVAALPLVVYLVRRLGNVPLPIAETIRGGSAAVAAAILAYVVTRALPALPGLAAGVVTYFGVLLPLAFVLRAVKREDRVWVVGTLALARNRGRAFAH